MRTTGFLLFDRGHRRRYIMLYYIVLYLYIRRITVLRRNNKICYMILCAYTNITIIYSTRTRLYEQWYNDIRTLDAAAAVRARLSVVPITIVRSIYYYNMQ